jgi:hypothetical protein
MATFPARWNSISTHDNHLEALKAIDKLFEKSEATVTFWGSRVVQLKNIAGSESLFDVTHKVYDLSANCFNKHSNKNELTIEERLLGLKIVKKIETFQQETDKQLVNANLLTKCLAVFQDAVLHIFRPESTLFGSIPTAKAAEHYFRGYKKEHFLTAFAATAENYEEHPAYFGSSVDGSVLMAKSSALKALDAAHAGILDTVIDWFKGD